MDRTGLCGYPGCDLWGSPYCERHRGCFTHLRENPHKPSQKPHEIPHLKVDPTHGPGRHRRPDGTPISRLGDGSLDPGPCTITREEYHRRMNQGA